MKSKLLTLAVAALSVVLAAATVASGLMYAESGDTVHLVPVFVNPVLMLGVVTAHGIHEDNRRSARRRAVRASMNAHPSRSQSGV